VNRADLLVSVSAADIAFADASVRGFSPVELAIERHFKAQVIPWGLGLKVLGVGYFILPLSADNWVSHWEEGKPVAPFTFALIPTRADQPRALTSKPEERAAQEGGGA
jgi:hypothetical protein